MLVISSSDALVSATDAACWTVPDESEALDSETLRAAEAVSVALRSRSMMAAVMLASGEAVKRLNLTPLARIASFGTSGLDPATMGMGPVPASQKALARAGWKAQDLDLLEINEAFAAQACAVNQEMAWDTSKVNVNGGAIAIGHPIGASGCRILVTLLHEMGRRGAKKGIASLCIGGGMGVALTIER
jgi:acetyl-CoA C-acetyltransferase